MKTTDMNASATIPQHERVETITTVGNGAIMELAPGIQCEALVGKHNGAVNLFTAIVTFAPETQLPAHTHPHAESITLLSGQAIIEIENRRYNLFPMDNVTIPSGYVHLVKNISKNQPAVLHIAMPVSTPQRDLITPSYATYDDMADDFSGKTVAEYITRYSNAERYNAGSGTEFINYFNEELIAGIGMSGGFGLFHKNGRLPAHFHDFDESICIVLGEAICVTERNRYTLSGLSTALQPHGLPHYFINPFDQTMSMIWVYAGAMPIRTEVADF